MGGVAISSQAPLGDVSDFARQLFAREQALMRGGIACANSSWEGQGRVCAFRWLPLAAWHSFLAPLQQEPGVLPDISHCTDSLACAFRRYHSMHRSLHSRLIPNPFANDDAAAAARQDVAGALALGDTYPQVCLFPLPPHKRPALYDLSDEADYFLFRPPEPVRSTTPFPPFHAHLYR